MSETHRTIIIGAGGHGRSTLDVLRATGNLYIEGFLDDFAIPGSHVLGAVVLGPIENISQFVDDCVFIVGRGKIGKSTHRKQIAELCWAMGGSLIVGVSPHSYVADSVSLGE